MPTREPTNLLSYGWPGTYSLGAEEIAVVTQVLEAKSPNRFFGPDILGYSQQLEAAFCSRWHRGYALAVNSCSAALLIAMEALGIGPGDEVLVPGLMWVACIGAIVRAGAIPRLVEIDNSFTLDLEDLAAKIGPRTKAILAVHMSGAPANIEAIMALATAKGLFVIEDLAQANGGSFNGKPLGSFGHAAVVSFQINKNMTAGEGGLVAFNDEHFYRRAVELHDVGYVHNEFGHSVFRDSNVQLWGLGSHMNELSAAVLVEQEKKLDATIEGMRRASRWLYDGLATIPEATIRHRHDPDGDTGPFMFVTWPSADFCGEIVKRTTALGVTAGPKFSGNSRLATFGLHLYYEVASLANRVGTNATHYPWTAPENEFALGYAYGKGTLPRSDDLFARTSMLNVAPVLTEESCSAIVEAFRISARDIQG